MIQKLKNLKKFIEIQMTNEHSYKEIRISYLLLYIKGLIL